ATLSAGVTLGIYGEETKNQRPNVGIRRPGGASRRAPQRPRLRPPLLGLGRRAAGQRKGDIDRELYASRIVPGLGFVVVRNEQRILEAHPLRDLHVEIRFVVQPYVTGHPGVEVGQGRGGELRPLVDLPVENRAGEERGEARIVQRALDRLPEAPLQRELDS